MIILFILGLIIGGAAIVFALQNIEVVTVNLFGYHITGSLSLIIMITLAVGAFTMVLFLLPENIKNYFAYRNLIKENKKLQEELRKQKELTVFTKAVPPAPEII